MAEDGVNSKQTTYSSATIDVRAAFKGEKQTESTGERRDDAARFIPLWEALIQLQLDVNVGKTFSAVEKKRRPVTPWPETSSHGVTRLRFGMLSPAFVFVIGPYAFMAD